MAAIGQGDAVNTCNNAEDPVGILAKKKTMQGFWLLNMFRGVTKELRKPEVQWVVDRTETQPNDVARIGAVARNQHVLCSAAAARHSCMMHWVHFFDVAARKPQQSAVRADLINATSAWLESKHIAALLCHLKNLLLVLVVNLLVVDVKPWLWSVLSDCVIRLLLDTDCVMPWLRHAAEIMPTYCKTMIYFHVGCGLRLKTKVRRRVLEFGYRSCDELANLHCQSKALHW